MQYCIYTVQRLGLSRCRRPSVPVMFAACLANTATEIKKHTAYVSWPNYDASVLVDDDLGIVVKSIIKEDGCRML